MDDVIEIKRKLVEEIYNNDVTTPYKINLFDFFKDFKRKWIKRAVNELLEENIIDAAGSHQIKKKRRFSEITTDKTDLKEHVFFYQTFIAYLTDKGILEHENYIFDDPTKYGIEFVHFLQFLEETEEGHLNKKEIINGVISKGSTRSSEFLEELLFNSISQTCVFSKNLPLGNEKFIFSNFKNDFNTITDYGRDVLDKYKSSNELFQKHIITNRKLLLQEYKSIDGLIKLGYWKDVCIKMGSILEYLLTKWLENKNINSINHSKISNGKPLTKATFFDKMSYYLETAGNKFSFEIGKDTEWEIAQNIFREYRNYIHLQEYEKRISTIGPLDESSFLLLERVFNKIINYF